MAAPFEQEEEDEERLSRRVPALPPAGGVS